MAGKIIADIIETPAGRISLNVGNTVVASINATGIFTSTGNLVITQANSIGTAAIEDGAVTNAKLSLSANDSNIKTALNASGSAPIYACRAWVNFDGTGTPAIRASGNVSSITDNGNGDYTVNFTTAMPDANYALAGASGNDGEIFSHRGYGSFPQTTTTVRVAISNGGRIDSSAVMLAIFR